MSCCRSSRRAAPAPRPGGGDDHHLRLRGERSVEAVGPVTGRTYRFTAEAPDQYVHRRDAPYLMASGYFTRVP